MSRLTAPADAAGIVANSIIAMTKIAAVLYIKVFVLVFALISLLRYDRDWGGDPSPAITDLRKLKLLDL
jgi:hypothetical protein